jgi:hypothetical protein
VGAKRRSFRLAGSARGGTALDYAYDEISFELISRALFPDLETRDRKALEWLAQFRGGRLGEDSRDATPLARALLVRDWGYYPPPPRRRLFYASENYARAYEDQILNRVRTLLRIGANPMSEPNPVAPRYRSLSHKTSCVWRGCYLRAVLIRTHAGVNASLTTPGVPALINHSC